MKNMKKLLGAVAALGFSTVSAINVVACSNPAKSNDLDKSFETSYNVPFSSSSMADSGLVADGNKFDFIFGTDYNSGLKQTLIASILKPKTGAAINQGSIIKQQNETTAPNFPAATKNALAAGVIGTNQNGLTADANHVVKVPIKLVLWKSVTDGNGFKWEKQNVTKDITLNISTIIDISTIIPGTITLGQLSANTVGAFKTALQAKLITFQNLKTINTSDYDVYKAGTGKNLITDSDIADGNSLSIKIVAKGDTFTGTKDNITANYIRTIIDISTIIPGTITLGQLSANTVGAFKTALQAKLITFQNLKTINTSDYDVYKAGTGKNLITDSDVAKESPLSIKIVAKGDTFTGTKDNITANYIRTITHQDTIYVDSNGQKQTTSDRDLSNLNTTEIIQIGFYQNSQGQIQVVRMPNTVLKVPDTLPQEITSLSSMFEYTKAFNQDISTWNTSNVTDMSVMFYNAKAFNQDISKWNTSQVTDLSMMFYGNRAFNQDISSWNTSQVTNMSNMFYNATAFNQDLSNWNVNKVKKHSEFATGSGFAGDSSKWPKFNN